MTNYNERLDDILADVKAHSILVAAEDSVTGYDVYTDPGLALVRAKQALTSLIKELVAEAKPAKKIGAPVGKYETGGECGAYADGSNEAADQFEQDLLKKLEEV